jgi:cellulose synthase/poly-beta-1,6-N-acetylglucosamine synthase-like glycosyltransferase
VTDDFVVPMKVRQKGFRVVYDPEAVAYEDAPATAEAEFRRRCRIGAGNAQSLRQCAGLLVPWRGVVAFAFWSHKVFRWFTPFLLVLGFAASAALAWHPIWLCLLGMQVVFYVAGLLGGTLRRLGAPAGPLWIVYYFLMINLAIGIGMVRGMFGRQSAAWRRTSRSGGSD